MPKKYTRSVYTNALTHATIEIYSLYGFYVWRSNNIAVLGRSFTGKRGIGDIVGMTPNGIHIEIEIKTGSDKLSDHQKEHQNEIQRHNGEFEVVRNLQDLKEKTKSYRIKKELRPHTERIYATLQREEEIFKAYLNQKKQTTKQKREAKKKGRSLPKLN